MLMISESPLTDTDSNLLLTQGGAGRLSSKRPSRTSEAIISLRERALAETEERV